ncbi:MAG: TetR/AcrR family transcriptional regulator [Planctomycetota bacterium]
MDTRDRILTAAMRLFHEQGFSATGVSTILREAGVNSGSLYHCFPNKEAVLRGVLERYTELLGPVVLEPREREQDDPIERVFDLLAWYRRGMEQTHCRLGCPIGNLALEVSDAYPEVRTLIDNNFRGWASGIRGWLDEAGDRLSPETDLDALASFVLTVMEGGLMQARAAGSLEPFDRSVAVLRSHFQLITRQDDKQPEAKA